VPHDRIHAREPSHHVDRWTVGRIEAIEERDGHAVVTVRPTSTRTAPGSDELVDLVVTLAVRDLFVRRLDLDADESPVGERVWYRVRGE
jgi:hypothetical protein